MAENRRDPVILDLDETPLPEVPGPAEAPPVPTAPPPAAERALATARRRRISGVARLFWGSLAGLVTLWAGLSLERFITAQIAERPWAGWLALALAGALAAAVLAIVAGELSGLARLKRIEDVRERARSAREGGTPAAADAALAGLSSLYDGRPECAAARARLRAARGDTPDALARLGIAEREYLAPLDRRAGDRIAVAAREVAAATALIPMPLVDMLSVLLVNLRMIRAVAEIYGGRAGWLGSWRLMRAVATHLIATGAIAATDDLLGPMVGGGVLGKLSRRFGEAAVNAALTARIGSVAIQVCRPLPFEATPRPKARTMLLAALKDWRGEPRQETGP